MGTLAYYYRPVPLHSQCQTFPFALPRSRTAQAPCRDIGVWLLWGPPVEPSNSCLRRHTSGPAQYRHYYREVRTADIRPLRSGLETFGFKLYQCGCSVGRAGFIVKDSDAYRMKYSGRLQPLYYS